MFRANARLLTMFSLVLGSAVAHAGTFGGYAQPPHAGYADGGQLCTLASVDAAGKVVSSPTCTPRPARLRLARVAKPASTVAQGAVTLSVTTAGSTVSITGDAGEGPVALVVYDAGAEISRVKGPFVSADGGALALEISLGPGQVQAVAFDVRASLGRARRADGPLARLEAGKTWVQPLVACERTGVTLTLAKERRFSIRTESKCEGLKNSVKVSGSYRAEGEVILLVFPGDDGAPDEVMRCLLDPCTAGAGECLRCDDQGAGFEARPATAKAAD
jgi:hypothetical protein